MAISSSASTAALTSGALAQIQQLQAQRNANQAEQQAQSLRARAQAAQSQADRAQENARSLRLQSSQAQGEASSARRGLAAMKSANDVQTSLGNLRADIKAALVQNVASTEVSTPGTTINAQGQTTGTLISVTA